MEFSSQIDKVIWQQNQMISVLSAWQVVGMKQLPLCANLAIHLSVLTVQSANVERVCKAHAGVLHTKTRNRLVNKLLHMLLVCSVNLCLLRKGQVSFVRNS
jgi:ribosomal protein S26